MIEQTVFPLNFEDFRFLFPSFRTKICGTSCETTGRCYPAFLLPAVAMDIWMEMSQGCFEIFKFDGHAYRWKQIEQLMHMAANFFACFGFGRLIRPKHALPWPLPLLRHSIWTCSAHVPVLHSQEIPDVKNTKAWFGRYDFSTIFHWEWQNREHLIPCHFFVPFPAL